MAARISIAPPAELVRFAERQALWEQHKSTTEHRSENRQTLVTPALLQPVDTALEVVGDPIPAMTRDISRSGLGVIVEKLPRHRLFAMHFVLGEEETCLLVNAKWTEHDGPFEYVGLRSLAVLEIPRTVSTQDSEARQSFRFAESLAT